MDVVTADEPWYAFLEKAQAMDDAVWLMGMSAQESAKAWGSFVRILRKCHDGPPPLCIDGHEYRRRQRRRSKGRR